MIPANRINLDGDALLVGSDDANDVRHETLPHRGPHQAIAVAHLVLRDLVDKDVEGLPRRRNEKFYRAGTFDDGMCLTRCAHTCTPSIKKSTSEKFISNRYTAY